MEALAPALQGTAAAGAWGKTERRSWGSDSPTHLGRRWSEVAWPRQRPELGDGSGGCGTAELGKGRGQPEWLCGGGEQLGAPFIGKERRWRGGRGGRPVLCARAVMAWGGGACAGDATARALRCAASTATVGGASSSDATPRRRRRCACVNGEQWVACACSRGRLGTAGVAACARAWRGAGPALAGGRGVARSARCAGARCVRASPAARAAGQVNWAEARAVAS